MRKVNWLLGAAVAAVAAVSPAAASVIVVGNGNAAMCYHAADSVLRPTTRELRRCDEALRFEALSDYEEAATYVNRGILRLRRNMIDDAVADFDRAIARDPEQAEAYLNKGAALLTRRNPGEAVQLFTVALERNTRRPALAHYGRAVAQEDLGDLTGAYRDFRRASELAPDWREPQIELTRYRVAGR